MRLSNRHYGFGDQIVFLAQLNGRGIDLSGDAPVYNDLRYVLVEGVISSLGGSYGFGGPPPETNNLSVTYSLPNDRMRAANVPMDTSSIREINTVLSAREDLTEEQKEFLRQFVIPIPVSNAAYRKLLRDFVRAVRPEGELEPVSDLDQIMDEAHRLNISTMPMNMNSTNMTSRFSDRTLSTFREWEISGIPIGWTQDEEDSVDADMPDNTVTGRVHLDLAGSPSPFGGSGEMPDPARPDNEEW